ncbi:MAG: thioesterase [Chitinophagaceae bacterium]
MNNAVQEFIQTMKHPVKFRMFLFTKLPAAFFSGVRLKEINEQACIATIPFKWFSQNPFKSTYFACLAMAAELTTGSLAMMQLYKRKPAVSMLVVKLEAVYYKKATGITFFTCADGGKFKAVIEQAIETGEAQSFTASSYGVNEQGEKIADFFITWSFKKKSNQA